MSHDPFHIEGSAHSRLGRGTLLVARPFLSWLLRLRRYRALYRATQRERCEPFERRALEALQVEAQASVEDRTHIPPNGPLLIASNHPHGALDGLALASVLREQRTDVRILTNHLLARIPELDELCFFVDPFGGPEANARSHAGLRAAHLWLRRGGALVVFPSGEVAHRSGPTAARIDSPWRTTVGRLVLSTGAQVVPAFIEGTNSRLFYAAGRVHSSFRTALLARELLKKRGQRITVRFGAPLQSRDLAVARDAADATQLIRQRVDQLAGFSPTASRRSSQLMAAELESLPASSRLVESGDFQVFVADATQIPQTLQEIGRLREVTYRIVGEGTGRVTDLDGFDEQYLHLFAWDAREKQVVGAYRIGPTDRIAATRGVHGLYTRTLFRYDERLIARISPALELGRSFVRAEYQRNYSSLLLLWKGIGQFVVRHPRYRVLFGPVSISARYSDSSHQLLMAFLQQNHRDQELADLVQALNPRPASPAPTTGIPRSMDEANRLVAAAEADGKGVPILLRQYLKLNAKVLGFNVDRDFGDALDALMMVDLTTVERTILNRYLGRHEAVQFLAHHRTRQSADAA